VASSRRILLVAGGFRCVLVYGALLHVTDIRRETPSPARWEKGATLSA